MRLTYLAYSFSLTIMYFSIVLLVPIAVALYYHEYNAVLPFLIAGAAAFFISITLKKLNLIDYDDMLISSVRLLEENPDNIFTISLISATVIFFVDGRLLN